MKDRTRYEQSPPKDWMTSLGHERYIVRAIARTMYRAPATISPELLRDTADGPYGAQRACQKHRGSAKPETCSIVMTLYGCVPSHFLAGDGHPTKAAVPASASSPTTASATYPTKPFTPPSSNGLSVDCDANSSPGCAKIVAPSCRAQALWEHSVRFRTCFESTCNHPRSKIARSLHTGRVTSLRVWTTSLLRACWLGDHAEWFRWPILKCSAAVSALASFSAKLNFTATPKWHCLTYKLQPIASARR